MYDLLSSCDIQCFGTMQRIMWPVPCGLFLLKFCEHWTGNQLSTIFTQVLQQLVISIYLKQTQIVPANIRFHVHRAEGYQQFQA
jgi:hypothetical protein